MDRLTQRLATATAALATLDELAHKPDRSKVERDAAIQRFEYTFEAVWKAAQFYLREIEGLDVGSPKGAARAAFETGLLDEAETRHALAMADDRTLSVHTYNETLANEIAERLSAHATLLRNWTTRMVAHIGPGGPSARRRPSTHDGHLAGHRGVPPSCTTREPGHSRPSAPQ